MDMTDRDRRAAAAGDFSQGPVRSRFAGVLVVVGLMCVAVQSGVAVLMEQAGSEFDKWYFLFVLSLIPSAAVLAVILAVATFAVRRVGPGSPLTGPGGLIVATAALALPGYLVAREFLSTSGGAVAGSAVFVLWAIAAARTIPRALASADLTVR